MSLSREDCPPTGREHGLVQFIREKEEEINAKTEGTSVCCVPCKVYVVKSYPVGNKISRGTDCRGAVCRFQNGRRCIDQNCTLRR